MSTSFNFPTNPTLNQVVVLPDGNSAQWNGYAWVSVGDNVAYPLVVGKGGTGATNPFTAKRNLDIPIWTLDDAAPVAPVFGDRWIRPGSMTEVVWLPNANPAGGGVWVNLADVGSVVYPVAVSKGGTGATTAAGARTNLGIDPLIAALLPLDGSRAMTGALKLSDGTVAAPGLAFNSEPGLGWYRNAAGSIRLAAGGADFFVMGATDPAATNIFITTRSATLGNTQLELRNATTGQANYSAFGIALNPAGAVTLATTKQGTATRGNLTLDAPVVTATGGITATGAIQSVGPCMFAGGGANYLGFAGNNTNYAFQWANAIGMLSYLGPGNATLLQFDNVGNANKASGGTAWGVVSDVRAKTDIEDWDGGLDKVLSLRPRKFTRIDTGERSIGCIADEAETGFAELIHRAPGKVGDTEYPDLATLHIDPLFWALVNATKELSAKLDAALTRIAALEAA